MASDLPRLAFEPDRRTGELILWVDTCASLRGCLLGVGVATLAALCFGIAIGFIPRVRALLAPFVAVISLIPPLAMLPILFIVFGLGETVEGRC